MSAIADLRAAITDAVTAIAGREGITPALDRPRKEGHGDYATNAAMMLAGIVGEPPRDVAARLADDLQARLGDSVDRIEIAGPGFLNLFLSDAWHRRALTSVLSDGSDWGRGGAEPSERINVEFVSVNPTGPLHVGHARNAAYGDALARILTFHGHTVEREYYVNDYGSQVTKFGLSLQARARGEEPPEDGYAGSYVATIAAEVPAAADRPIEEVAWDGVAVMLAHNRASLAAFGVEFDVWFSERSLHEGDPSPVEHAFAELAAQGRTYQHEGALWLRTTTDGDDKDRVLERSTGEHTYFASDIAYHLHKRERGFERLIDVWGADHHGYVERVKAGFAALGGDRDRLELVIMQLVRLVSNGEEVRMSKRTGDFVTLDELVSEVGVDAARWFLLNRSHDTTVEFDMDLAREQSSENPVYYVQYAHARIASILGRAGADQVASAPAALDAEGELHPAERALVQKLLAFPAEVDEAARRRAPHRIATYALELAQSFSAFYRDCQVLGLDDERTELVRLSLCRAAAATVAQSLDLLGVTAPEEM